MLLQWVTDFRRNWIKGLLELKFWALVEFRDSISVTYFRLLSLKKLIQRLILVIFLHSVIHSINVYRVEFLLCASHVPTLLRLTLIEEGKKASSTKKYIRSPEKSCREKMQCGKEVEGWGRGVQVCSLLRWHWSKHLREERNGALWTSGKKIFQALCAYKLGFVHSLRHIMKNETLNCFCGIIKKIYQWVYKSRIAKFYRIYYLYTQMGEIYMAWSI